MSLLRAFADLPIRRKLSAGFLLTGSVTVLAASAAYLGLEYSGDRRTFAESITTTTRIAADNSSAAIAFKDDERATEILNSLHGEPQIVAAALYDSQGVLLASYRRHPEATVPATQPVQTGTWYEPGRLIAIQSVVEDGRWWGTLYVEASLARLRAGLASSALLVLLVAVATGTLGWLLSRILQRRIANPIIELAGTARAISERQDFSLRAPVASRDELGELGQAFNAMLARIEQSHAERDAAAAEIQALNARLEQRVQERTAQLEAANRELESFSYSVSHDLRAPLRHIQGYADMLVRATNGGLPEKAQRYLNVIVDASGEMGQLIDDLLAFSRMGRSGLRQVELELGPILEEVRQGLEMQTRDRAIEWHFEPLPRVYADAMMIKLVFGNLIGNAVKFTRTRNPAVISVRCTGQEGSRVVLCVQDNGVGFDMAYYDKLFGVFQRLHRAEDFEGTGIGLANVRRIISRHGGRVWAESALDAGAAFYFTLETAAAVQDASTSAAL